MNDDIHLEIKVGKYTFLFSIKVINDFKNEPYQYRILVGDKHLQKCVSINVDERLRLFLSPEIAHIDSIRYNSGCSFDEKLDSGEDTRFMVNLALVLGKKHFTYVEHFKLKDDCIFDNGNGMPMSMAHYQLAMYGETWYERHFFAKLQNGHDIYRVNADKLKENGKPNHDVMFERFIKNKDNDCQSLFTTSSTYNDFFQRLRKLYGNEFCNNTRDWLPDFVNAVIQVRVNTTWIISGRFQDNLNMISYVRRLNKMPDYPPLQMKGGFSIGDADF